MCILLGRFLASGEPFEKRSFLLGAVLLGRSTFMKRKLVKV